MLSIAHMAGNKFFNVILLSLADVAAAFLIGILLRFGQDSRVFQIMSFVGCVSVIAQYWLMS